jgi:hypothetical protein
VIQWNITGKKTEKEPTAVVHQPEQTEKLIGLQSFRKLVKERYLQKNGDDRHVVFVSVQACVSQ